MILRDKNETLKPPAGGEVCGVFAEGSYLRVRYSLPDMLTDVYLNDQGREVARLSWKFPEKPPEPLTREEEDRLAWAKQVAKEDADCARWVREIEAFQSSSQNQDRVELL